MKKGASLMSWAWRFGMLGRESRLQRESEQDFCEEEKSCNGRNRRDENNVVFPLKSLHRKRSVGQWRFRDR